MSGQRARFAVLKVCHVITGLHTGGAEMMLYKLLSRMDRAAVESRVISLTEPGPLGPRIAELGVEVETLGMHKGLRDLLAVPRLVSRLRELRPDVVQTWLYHADLIGGVAARLAGVGAVIWNVRQSNLQGAVNSRLTMLFARAAAILSRRIPERVVCCAEAVREAHRAFGYAAERLVVIPNGFDLTAMQRDPAARDSLRAELGLESDAVLVGLVGRFDPQKDHRNFLLAAAQILEQRPDTHFVLAGDEIVADNSKLSEWIAKTGGAEHFHLLGRRGDIARINSAVDVAVSASLGEGFANVIGEAMACEAVCVVTDVGDSAAIVADCGEVVPARDPEALARGCLRLLGLTEAQRRALGRRARERIAGRYELGVIARQYQTLYESVNARVRNHRLH
jgi:glycosyltransferase involved in cell wall biosynthesis